MGSTAFLSMWISNTATAAMMLPIAHAVLEEIKEENQIDKVSKNGRHTLTSVKYTRSYNSTVENGEMEGEVSIEDDKEDNMDAGREDKNISGTDDIERSRLLDNEATSDHGGVLQEDGEIVKAPFEDEVENADESDMDSSGVEDRVEVTAVTTETAETRNKSTDKSYAKLTKCLMLGVAYSANIGGTATLTGTGPNIVLSGLARWVVVAIL